jgi:teichuronic acid biosynthesis glycosyltransferase TuaH
MIVPTRGIYPLKLNEYLAAGKPVVSTNFSEDIAMFSDYIYLSNTHEEFLANIERALNENTEQKKAERVKVAEGNSWQVRCGQFWQLVQPYLKR